MLVPFNENIPRQSSSRQLAPQKMSQHIPVVVYQGGRNRPSAVANKNNGQVQMMRRAQDDMFGVMGNMCMNMFSQMENMFQVGFGAMRPNFPQSTRNANYNQFDAMPRQKPMRVMSRTYVMETKFDPQGRPYQEGYVGQQLRKRASDGREVVRKEEHYFDTRDDAENVYQDRRINNNHYNNNDYYDNDDDYGNRNVVRTQKPKRSNSQAVRKVQNPYSGRQMIGYGNQNPGNLGDQEWVGVFQMNDHVGQRPSVSRNSEVNQSLVSSQRPSISRNSEANQPLVFSQRPSIASSRPNTASTRPSVTHSQRSERNVATPQSHARVRRNDIQPTQPNNRGAIALPQSNENRNPNNVHAHRERAIPLHQATGDHHHDNHAQNENHNVNIAPVRKNSGMKNDGIFKNKVVHKDMPMAG